MFFFTPREKQTLLTRCGIWPSGIWEFWDPGGTWEFLCLELGEGQRGSYMVEEDITDINSVYSMPEDQPHSTANSTGGWQHRVYCGPGWEKLVQGDGCVQGSGPSWEASALLKWTFLVCFCKS